VAAKKKNNPEVEETVEEVVEEVTEETVEECEAADEACNEQDEKDAAIEALNDRYRRLLAEFDNYKKRTEKEKSMMYEFGAKDALLKMLPIVDNFERGLASVPVEDKESAFADGMNKIYKQFMTTLEEVKVVPIEAVGKTFDPNLHNAVMHIDDDSYSESEVVEEFQKGYMYKESVLRHSMVKVAN